MKNNVLFKGIIPALVSPVDESGRVKVSETRALVRYLMSWGVTGFYICGSTGEGLVLQPDTRKKLLETVLEETNGRVPVIDHIGCIDLKTTLELAVHAKSAGASAVSSIPPIYFKYGDDDVVNYYKAITDVCDLPLLMYGVGSASTSLSLGIIEKVMELPSAIGIKWTYPDYYTLGRIKELNGGNINVINGPDEMLVCGLAMGADAGIGTTYNLMPGLFVKLYNSFTAGDTATARKIQHAINNVITVLIKYQVIPSTKALLTNMGFDVGFCTYPLHRLSDDENKAFLSEVSEFVDFEKQEPVSR